MMVAIVPQILQTPADRRLSRIHTLIDEIGINFKDRRRVEFKPRLRFALIHAKLDFFKTGFMRRR